MGYQKGQHTLYLLQYHLIFVTNRAKEVFDEEISSFIIKHSQYLLGRWNGELIKAEVRSNHVRLWITLPPNSNISVVVRSLKTQLSKEIKATCKEKLRLHYKDDDPLWSNTYFAATKQIISEAVAEEYKKSQKIKKRRNN